MSCTSTERTLALLGGAPAVVTDDTDLFAWPVVTKEDEDAVLDVLRRGGMSETDVTRAFEADYAAWLGVDHALGFSCGTAALHTAMWACEVGRGDEIIAPGMTYWASCLPAFALGATVAFADIDPDTLCIDPGDIEHRVTDRTRAIVAVHYAGYPAEMDAILDIARRHGLRVIEDASHAHGGRYKGRPIGTLGDVAAFSLMSRKSLAIGEAGMLVTGDRDIYERSLAFAHYERHGDLTLPQWTAVKGYPLGGVKYRMHQLSAAMGRVQLRHYAERMAGIDKAMNLFWDLLDGAPGLQAHRPPGESGSTMGGWYSARGIYKADELGGLPAARFAEAVRAEGSVCAPGANEPLHLHPLFNDVDVYGDGKPTRLAFAQGDPRQPAGSLPMAESINTRAIKVPWFKKCDPKRIEAHAAAFRKVAESHAELLADVS